MQITILGPIIAVIALLAKAIFGIEIGEELQAQVAEAIGTTIVAAVAVYGVVKGQRKKDKEPKAE